MIWRLIQNFLQRVRKRIEEAHLAANPSDVAREDTLLMVVGRGTNDADAKLQRLQSRTDSLGRYGLWLGGGCVIAASHIHAWHQGWNALRSWVSNVLLFFPYFLFTGILIKRIRDETAKVREMNPEIDYVDAPYPGRPPPKCLMHLRIALRKQ